MEQPEIGLVGSCGFFADRSHVFGGALGQGHIYGLQGNSRKHPEAA